MIFRRLPSRQVRWRNRSAREQTGPASAQRSKNQRSHGLRSGLFGGIAGLLRQK